jgi:hypothetical protein
LDHHHFINWLTVINYILIWQVNSGLDIGYKITDEFVTSLIEGLVEKVEKVGNKFPEKSLNKLMTKAWLQLIKELSILDSTEIEVKGFLCELLDRIIELFTEVFWPCFFKNSDPVFDLFLPVIDDVLNGDIRAKESANSLHKEGKHTNSKELDEHLEGVLGWSVAFIITITNSSERCNHPVNGCNVHSGVVSNVDSWAFVAGWIIFMTLFQPGAFSQFGDADPCAPYKVASRHKIYYQHHREHNLADRPLVDS